MSAMGELVQSMRDRMPWPVARRILEENEVARGRGWPNTLAKLNDERRSSADKYDAVTACFLEHVLCGEKLVRFYHADRALLDQLRYAAAGLTNTIPPSPFRARYPQPLTEDELGGLDLGHTLVAVEELDDGLAMVFSSVRSVTTRVEISAQELPEEALAILDDFDELVGVKTKRVQGMDALWIPKEGNYLEVRIDFPTGMLRNAGDFAQASVLQSASTLLGVSIANDPVNLYPLISRMYHDPSEGSVVELAFGTTSAALKHEKMRRGSISLRKESYHLGGLAALADPISPFKVSLEWERQIDERIVSKPELSLHANARVSGGTDPRLSDAIVRNCMGCDDYNFVRDRILHHLIQELADNLARG